MQGIHKVPLSIEEAGIDLCTVSGHKFHGLKGTGALIVKKERGSFRLSRAARKEKGVRAGTEHTAGAVSLAKAINLSARDMNERLSSVEVAKNALMERLSGTDGVVINTPAENSAPHIINFSVPGVKAEVLPHMLEEKGIYVSTTAACSAREHKPSHVLLQMNKGEQIASSKDQSQPELQPYG